MMMRRLLIDPALTKTNNFGFVRLALAILVVFNHGYKLSGSGDDPITRLVHDQMKSGAIAVSFFFAISGFLVTKSWASSGAKLDYLRKRCLRIYPGYLATVLVCAVFVVPLAVAQPLAWGPYYLRVIGRAPFFEPPFIAPSFFAHNPIAGFIDGSLWSLKYEFLCYFSVLLVAPLAARVHRALPLTVVVAALLVVAHSGGVAAVDAPEGGSSHALHLLQMILGNLATWPILLAFFFSGMSIHFFADRLPRSRWMLLTAVGALGVATWRGGLPVALPLLGTYALFYGIYTRSPLHVVGTSVDLSYGIYLHSFWVQQVFVAAFPAIFLHKALPLFFASLFCSACLAFLSWTYVEAPSQRIRFRLFKAPTLLAQADANEAFMIGEPGSSKDAAPTEPRK
jgi:peptidoglycan/LPS O-acetylase OafA/YrhL